MYPDSYRQTRLHLWLLLLIFALSLPAKLIAAHNMVWDMDIVAVIIRVQDFIQTGVLPAYGTLSSVAAYNLPFLVWLHLPASLLTSDPFQIMLLTLLAFNLIGTVAMYHTGATMFRPRAGLLAAALFTFSETGISSAYTAWAQLLLPGFFVLVLCALWQWYQRQQGIYLALAGIIATAAFMTHFSAILIFPVMLLFALITRARWQIGWLLIGTVVCLAMFAPYFAFQMERDGIDLRAFLSRETTVEPAIMAEYDSIKPGGAWQPESGSSLSASMDTTLDNVSQPEPIDNTPVNTAQRPRWLRLIDFVPSIPGQLLDGFALAFQSDNRALAGTLLYPLAQTLNGLFALAFFSAIPLALSLVYADLRLRQPAGKSLLHRLTASLSETVSGRVVLIVLMCAVIISGLILTRTAPHENATYYAGLLSLQLLVVAAALESVIDLLPSRRLQITLLAGIVTLTAGLATLDRQQRQLQHDDSRYSAYNVWLYRHVEAVTDWIAQDSDTAQPVIQYDNLPEMRHIWWILPWHSVDAHYRMGTPFDVLLATRHDIHNQNQAADGLTDDPDYIIVYTPGLSRYDLSAYDTFGPFGAIHILKPRTD